MCKSSKEPGGPRRCASHTRQELQAKQERLNDLSRKSEALSELQTMMKFPSNLVITKKKRAEVQNHLNVLSPRQDYVPGAWEYNKGYYKPSLPVEVFEQTRTKGFEAFASEVNRVTGMDVSTIQEDFLKAKKEVDEAEKSYLATEGGIFELATSGEGLTSDGKPSEKLENAIVLFSNSSVARGMAWKQKVSLLEAKAKALDSEEDYKELDKWRKAWASDPLLTSPEDRYTFHSAGENFIALRAPGWIVFLNKNDKGKVRRTISFR